MKKYEFSGSTLECEGKTLYRIRAIRDFGDVKAGDLGGWIGREENLSHYGDCWVYEEAKVYGNTKIFENAHVSGHLIIHDNAILSGNAVVCGKAVVKHKDIENKIEELYIFLKNRYEIK